MTDVKDKKVPVTEVLEEDDEFEVRTTLSLLSERHHGDMLCRARKCVYLLRKSVEVDWFSR